MLQVEVVEGSSAPEITFLGEDLSSSPDYIF